MKTEAKKIPTTFNEHKPWSNSGHGLPCVVVEDDAEPFIRKEGTYSMAL